MDKKSDILENFSDFLTINRAAEFLGVSPSTLRNWDRHGKLEAMRHPVNGYRLYRKQELIKVLRNIGINNDEKE